METLRNAKLTRLEALAAMAALAGLAGTGLSRLPTSAQEAEPAVSEPVWETLGAVNDPWLAPGMTLELARFTWMPGYRQQLHTHTAIDIIYVQSGEVAWYVENGEAQVIRTAMAGTPVPAETVVSGTEAILQAGDTIIFDYGEQEVWHAGRTVGTAPVVMLFGEIYDPSKPITVYAEDMGTPTA